jgi:hypothetical protein
MGHPRILRRLEYDSLNKAASLWGRATEVWHDQIYRDHYLKQAVRSDDLECSTVDHRGVRQRSLSAR